MLLQPKHDVDPNRIRGDVPAFAALERFASIQQVVLRRLPREAPAVATCVGIFKWRAPSRYKKQLKISLGKL
jgi:hypothetical protein